MNSVSDDERDELRELARKYVIITTHEETRNIFNMTLTEAGRRELCDLHTLVLLILCAVEVGGDRTEQNRRNRWSLFRHFREKLEIIIVDLFIRFPDRIRLPRLEYNDEQRSFRFLPVCSTRRDPSIPPSFKLLENSEAGRLPYYTKIPSKLPRRNPNDPTTDKRPNTPYAFNLPPVITPTTKDIPMALHHIIPVSTLKTFFEIRSREVKNRKFELRIIANLLRLNQLRLMLPLIWESSQEEEYDKMSPSFKLPSDDPRHLHQLEMEIFCWTPGNLFQGPRNRSDDPGSHFEKDCERIVGCERYAELLSFYNDLTTFNARYRNADSLHKDGCFEECALRERMFLAFEHAIIPWNSKQWSETKPGMWKIKPSNISSDIDDQQ